MLGTTCESAAAALAAATDFVSSIGNSTKAAPICVALEISVTLPQRFPIFRDNLTEDPGELGELAIFGEVLCDFRLELRELEEPSGRSALCVGGTLGPDFRRDAVPVVDGVGRVVLDNVMAGDAGVVSVIFDVVSEVSIFSS